MTGDEHALRDTISSVRRAAEHHAALALADGYTEASRATSRGYSAGMAKIERLLTTVLERETARTRAAA